MPLPIFKDGNSGEDPGRVFSDQKEEEDMGPQEEERRTCRFQRVSLPPCCSHYVECLSSLYTSGLSNLLEST